MSEGNPKETRRKYAGPFASIVVLAYLKDSEFVYTLMSIDKFLLPVLLLCDWAEKTKIFWHQSEARTAPTVCNWSVKTLSPGALTLLLDFSSPEFFSRLFRLFPAPLTAPGSPRMLLGLQILHFPSDL